MPNASSRRSLHKEKATSHGDFRQRNRLASFAAGATLSLIIVIMNRSLAQSMCIFHADPLGCLTGKIEK
jgi:hypothetical protein